MDSFIQYLKHVQEKFDRLVEAYDLLNKCYLYFALDAYSLDEKSEGLFRELQEYFEYDDSE